ncbi:MAG: exosortase/archaeosortase family protein [Cytophagales bacterium]|nr:exosortase/archaeosortase family protein [Cytophagales bacterium]
MFQDKEKLKAVLKFIITAFSVYVGWFCIHDFYLVTKTNFVQDLIFFETKLTASLLNQFPLFSLKFSSVENVLFYDVRRVIRIGEECSGLVLFVVFAGFILAFPGDWKSKSWFIPLGIVAIFFINILRFMFLAVNKLYFDSMFSFNHHVTFTYLVYAIIFSFWVLWMNKFRKVDQVSPAK